MSETQFNQVLNIELEQIIQVSSWTDLKLITDCYYDLNEWNYLTVTEFAFSGMQISWQRMVPQVYWDRGAKEASY